MVLENRAAGSVLPSPTDAAFWSQQTLSCHCFNVKMGKSVPGATQQDASWGGSGSDHQRSQNPQWGSLFQTPLGGTYFSQQASFLRNVERKKHSHLTRSTCLSKEGLNGRKHISPAQSFLED